jgi:hypothetical protein
LGFRSHDEKNMLHLHSSTGLRSNEKAIAAGAQNERRGLAGPVRDLLGGETSPAASVSAYFFCPVSFSQF